MLSYQSNWLCVFEQENLLESLNFLLLEKKRDMKDLNI